jgi:hypothetical protein
VTTETGDKRQVDAEFVRDPFDSGTGLVSEDFSQGGLDFSTSGFGRVFVENGGGVLYALPKCVCVRHNFCQSKSSSLVVTFKKETKDFWK